MLAPDDHLNNDLPFGRWDVRSFVQAYAMYSMYRLMETYLAGTPEVSSLPYLHTHTLHTPHTLHTLHKLHTLNDEHRAPMRTALDLGGGVLSERKSLVVNGVHALWWTLLRAMLVGVVLWLVMAAPRSLCCCACDRLHRAL